MMNDWSKFTLAELRGFARSYHRVTKIVGVAKLKREDLIKEMDKHLTVKYDATGNHQISLKTKPESVAQKAGPVKVERVVIGKERKPRADKGAKHTYPEGRKERNDKGKKRKPMAAAEPAMVMKKPERSTKV